MELHAATYKWLAMKRRWAGYSLSKRISRLWQHLCRVRQAKSSDASVTRLLKQPGGYLVDLFFYLLDLIAFGEFYETCCDWLKYNTRALNAEERQIVNELFGESIDVERIRIDNLALVPKYMRMAYVGVYTINHFGQMSEDLFVHELIHIWQYEHQGSVYIPRALRAQRSEAGYNYGGAEALKSGSVDMLSYNYEQQGDILADYWRTKNKRPTKWKNLTGTLVPYTPLVKQLYAHKNTDLA